MLKKKILVICPYPEGVAAGQRLKYEQYFENWKKNNYDIVVSSYYNLKTWKLLYKPGFLLLKICGIILGNFKRIIDLFRLKKFDLVYIFMWVTPLGSTFFERLFIRYSKKIIYDFNDSVFIKEKKQKNIYSNPIANFFKGSNKNIYLIKNSNNVIIDTPYHYEFCKNLNIYNRCSYIPCSLNIKYFKTITKYKNLDKVIRIGWTGTFSSKPYLDSIKNVFIELNKIHNFKLVIIGNFRYNISGIDIEVIEWNKETEIKDLSSIDIGIYPLIKNKWALGKGALKAMQYMSLSIPTVATDFGTTSKVIKHNYNGILVNNNDEWVIALDNLIKDQKERDRIGQNGRIEIIQNYSTEVIQSKYIEILN